MRHHLILISAVVWHAALSMASVLVPLYAHSLGYSSLGIGALVALPMVLNAVLRFVAGVFTDRWGEKALLLVCFSAMALAGPLYLLAESFLVLLLAQATVVLSVSFFYAAAQTYVTRIPTTQPMGKRLGFLGIANNAGAVAGMALAGVVIATAGFEVGFGVFTAVGLFAVLSGVLLPALPRRVEARSLANVLTRMGGLAAKPPMLLAIISAYGAAIPFALGQSFYPLFVAHLGYSEDLVGIAVAMRSVGAVLAGALVARMISMQTHRSFFRLAYVLLGASLLLMPLGGHFALVALLIGLSGFAALILDVGYQTTSTHFSDDSSRASAFAIGGLGWSLSPLTVPLAFGATVDGWGFAVAFYALGSVALATAAATALLYRWLMPAAQARQVQ